MMKDIHNNLPLIQLPLFTIFDAVIIVLMLVILGVLYWRFFYIPKTQKSAHTKKVKKYTPPPFSFNESIIFLEKLIAEGDWKQFALEATKTLKLVLQKKYKQAFLFATGRELIEILSKKDIPHTEKDALRKFFADVDPIKFAHQSMQKEHAEHALEIIKDLYE